MKKILSLIALTLVLAFTIALVGCGNKINQKAADKINDAAQNGEPMTMYEIKEKYGDPYIDTTKGVMGFGAGTGIAVWIDCAPEEVDAKTENKEKIAAITVTFEDYNAVSATFTDNYNNVTEE